MQTLDVDCTTGIAALRALSPAELAALRQAQMERTDQERARGQETATVRAATIAELMVAYRTMATVPRMNVAAAVMLKLGIGAAQGLGIDLAVSDFPADLQAALSSLPSGS